MKHKGCFITFYKFSVTVKVMQELPIGIQSFERLRENNYLYVDKTERLLDLISQGERYFLSRPRRFGKSLTLSTLEAMFKGNFNLFEGLKAYQWVQDQSKSPAPVLRLDISLCECDTVELLRQSLTEMLSRVARRFNIALHSHTVSGMFADLIEDIYNAQGNVVVLIDEYDRPILDSIGDLEKAEQMRSVLRSFYTVLKSCDDYLRFVMLTGISKFSKVGVFSALNNLHDISLTEKYSDIVGYTQNELESYFKEHINFTANKLKISSSETIQKLKDYYDGFSFDGKIRLYNPFSILNFFSDGRFENYWYISGSPTFIVKYMKKNTIRDPEEYRHITVASDFTDAHEIEKSTPESFLYQSGYLTIEKWIDDEITLDYPNQEVIKSLLRMYLDEVYKVKHYITLGTQIWDALSDGNINDVAALYNTALAEVPYEDFADRNEFWYRSLFLMLLRGAGVIAYAEVHTFHGRSDVVIQFETKIIVLEFKFAAHKSDVENKLIEGTQQIQERGYADSYDAERRKIICAVVVADDETRQVTAQVL